MAYIKLTEAEEVQVLRTIIDFLHSPKSEMGISEGPLPVYKILDYFVTDIPLLKTLRLETNVSYAEIIASETTADLYEEVSRILAETMDRVRSAEKKEFLSLLKPRKK